MKRIEEKKLSMYEVTRDLLQVTDSVIIDAMPQMVEYKTNLESNIISITNYGSSQSLNRKGIANDKDSLRNIAITKASDVARRVQGYAVNTNNLVLLKEVKYTSPQLRRLADNILVIVCNIIYDKAKAHIPDLAHYGVDDPVIIDLRKAIDKFDVSIPKPRTGIVTKKIATMTLKQLFNTTDTMLKDHMDVLVGVIKDAYPEFYASYTSSRKVINPGTHPLAIRCLVVDDSNNPISGVTAIAGDNMATFKTKTKGHFYVKTFPQGTYQFSFSKEGYETQPVTIIVANGERTDLKVTLAAIAQLNKAS